MQTKLPLILLPPSEGKRPGGGGPPWHPSTMALDLDAERGKVMKALRRAMRSNAEQRGRLLGVKGEALAAATTANRSLAESRTMSAIERYSGVLYGALDVATLDGSERRRLERSALIFSGLWGLVAPSDPLPDYKLKMGASLAPMGKLSRWWRPHVDAALELVLADLSGGGRSVVWNLLPKEHAAAWSGMSSTERGCVYTVRFLEPDSRGDLKSVSHWNKFLKGALVRYLLSNPEARAGDLAAWRHPSGFVLDESRTVVEGPVTHLHLVRVGG